MRAGEYTLGERIQAARYFNDMSPDKLAEAVGVEPKCIKRWEKDKEEPTASQIIALSHALKVTVNFLLDAGRVKARLLSTEWTPLHVLRLTPDVQHTPETALHLLETKTSWALDRYIINPNIDLLAVVKDLLLQGWLEWFDGALVLWMDAKGNKNIAGETRLLMWG